MLDTYTDGKATMRASPNLLEVAEARMKPQEFNETRLRNGGKRYLYGGHRARWFVILVHILHSSNHIFC